MSHLPGSWIVAIAASLVSPLGCRNAKGPHESEPPAAAPPSVSENESRMTLDPHSFARPDQVRVRHASFDWHLSFAERRLEGTAVLLVERIDEQAPLRLDARGLEIARVRVGEVVNSEPTAESRQVDNLSDTAWWVANRDPILGQGLEIELPERANAVVIDYRTGPDASGLQWLEPAQTADGEEPFLYTQSQAIHARSWFPSQDSPGVRMTYDARITSDEPVQVLMAAQPVPADDDDTFAYVMPQPVPAYLVALAAGDLAFRPLGKRSGVWAEPSVLDRAADEFADVPAMIAAAESLYGPYRWDRYDILVLPPAFPFGGMENPRLTFATPTILAGDRSLVALIAHELAHSWSGNLVTNATWEDLWLNEGFTSYIERRIVEALFGRERAEMEAVLGRQDLAETLAEVEPGDQHLHVELEGRDPDKGLTDVAYEKGALLLKTLEEAYGREAFDRVLQKWFDEHAFTSVTSAEFIAFAQAELANVEPVGPAPELEAWIHGPGVPSGAYEPHVTALERVDAARSAFLAGTLPSRELTDSWTPHEWLHFLRGLEGKASAEQLARLDEAFALTNSGNSEILAQWLELGVLANYRAVDVRLEAFLTEVGRRKFLTPLYQALLVADRRADAERIYAAARPGYHPISQGSIDQLLGESG